MNKQIQALLNALLGDTVEDYDCSTSPELDALLLDQRERIVSLWMQFS